MIRPSRRRARESALQLLYQIDVTGDRHRRAIDEYWQSLPEGGHDDDTRRFAEDLLHWALENRERIDAAIDAAAVNWDLARLSRVDLNLLRLGVAELLHAPQTPVAVVINEAVELARRFSDEKAAAFINGVLDRAARDAGRAERKEKR